MLSLWWDPTGKGPSLSFYTGLNHDSTFYDIRKILMAMDGPKKAGPASKIHFPPPHTRAPVCFPDSLETYIEKKAPKNYFSSLSPLASPISLPLISSTPASYAFGPPPSWYISLPEITTPQNPGRPFHQGPEEIPFLKSLHKFRNFSFSSASGHV